MIRAHRCLRHWKTCVGEKQLHRTVTTTPFFQKSNYLFLKAPPNEDSSVTRAEIVKFFGERQEWTTAPNKGTKSVGKPPKPIIKTPMTDARTMKESYVSCILPLKTDLELRDRFQSAYKQARLGRILEDMDGFASYAGYKHLTNANFIMESPQLLVTALVDSIIVINENINSHEDVRLSAHVSHAGKSSLEVCLLVDQKDSNGVYQEMMQTLFVFVAINPKTGKSTLVNPLVGETAEEKAYLEESAARQARRKSRAVEDLSQKPPDAEEREIIHKIFINQTNEFETKPRGLNNDVKYMDKSQLKTIRLCHPQYRNPFNKVFGGFIMRQAFELAFVNAFAYAKCRPTIVAIDDIIFLKPVNIGAFLRFTSQIGYVEKNYIHASVFAEIIDPATEKASRTNALQCTFKVDDPKNPPKELVFDSYSEAIIYLNSRRHFKRNMKKIQD